jgi:hypothetical protein
MSRINTTAELAALKDCAAKVMESTNGHHLRWAKAGCIKTLMNAGHGRDSAESLSASMVRFSVSFTDRADVLVAEFNQGAIA